MKEKLLTDVKGNASRESSKQSPTEKKQFVARLRFYYSGKMHRGVFRYPVNPLGF